MIRQLIILMLLITVCSSNCAVGESAYTADMLVADWTAKYVDSSYWKTQWLIDANNAAAVSPSEHHITQQDAIRIAVDALINLEYETPESLSKRYGLLFGFYFREQFGVFVWDVALCEEQKMVYRVQIDADAAQVYRLHLFNTIPIPQKFKEQNAAIDVLIDHWDELHSNSPKYSPEKYGSEMLAYPLPGEADIPQHEAMQYAVGMAHVLSGYDIDCFYEWLPLVSFDVSPMANRWSITLVHESPVSENDEVISFLFDAGTCSLESIGRHYTRGD